MREPPGWFQMVMYVTVALVAIWFGVHVAWLLAGLLAG